jgi:hypothetical protein
MNETGRHPSISLGLASVYLNATGPKLATRTWQATPMFLPCDLREWVPEGHIVHLDLWPLETDQPCTDLYDGSLATGMTRCTILRHGNFGAAAIPRDFDISQRLPGASNIGMADRHVDLVKLENLWNCAWHLNWAAPATRPGLTQF